MMEYENTLAMIEDALHALSGASSLDVWACCT